MIIQDKMTINIRTDEELEVFCDVAEKEGYLSRGGSNVREAFFRSPIAISVGYREGDVYPTSLSYQSIGNYVGLATNVVEASQLFRNHLISKRRNLH